MSETVLEEETASPRIAHDPDVCTGCGLCELMCSLYHEEEQEQ